MTKPTKAMRRAMAEAEVGDDVYGEDPTIKLLEARTAELLGKEAAVFVPSGTMANQIGVGVNTQPGDEVLCSSTSHVYVWEAGGIARLSGVTARTFEGEGGILRLEDLSGAIRPRTTPTTCERIWSVWKTRTIAAAAAFTPSRASARSLAGRAEHNLAMHLDGARLMNAVVASGHAASEWAHHFDTVSICFSKGLGAPVGSALAGTADAIRRGRRLRKLFGGGIPRPASSPRPPFMRLKTTSGAWPKIMTTRRVLADAFSGTEGFALESGPVETNLVWVKIENAVGTAAEVAAFLRSRNILVTVIGAQVIRACTHLDVSREEIEYTAGVIRDIEPALISAMTLVY